MRRLSDRWCGRAPWCAAVVLISAVSQAMCSSLVRAQTSSSAPASASSSASSANVARAELAAAYLRMDKAYSATPMDDSTRAQINRQFDRSTLSFFGGKFAAALAAIDSATTTLTHAPIVRAPTPPPRLVNDRAPSVARAAFLARLAKLDTSGPLAQAIIDARARAQLLVDEPSPERSAEFLSDPAAIARDLAREVSVLERGRNPFVGQAGDSWHTFRGAKGELIPMRILAPASAATSAAPAAVIIAFHGAGGDENMFANAYGQGILATMANDAHAILVTPLSTPFALNPAHFDSLMAVLQATYRVNPERIYVMGHSLGAGIAAQLAQARPKVIAAVACLSGGAAVTVADAPPMLFIGASLDPIIPASRVKGFAGATPASVYEELPNEGHTLMVANGVRRAVPWLFSHVRK